MKKVMLDRSVWDKMFKCLELDNCIPKLPKNDFERFDCWLKKKSIKVVLFSIEEIESYVNRGNSLEREIERQWLERKRKEYNCETCTNTFYSNDPNSLTNIRTVVSNKGNIDISPQERDEIIAKYHISPRKHRDLNILLILHKNNVDIFIHDNPADFARDTQIKDFITDMGIDLKILNLFDAIGRIKTGAI